MRTFGRGFMSGGALTLSLLILHSCLHLQSFTSALKSWNAQGARHVDTGLVKATVVIGGMSCASFLILFVMLLQWKDTSVAVRFADEYPMGP